eukprot:gene1861-1974_t
MRRGKVGWTQLLCLLVTCVWGSQAFSCPELDTCGTCLFDAYDHTSQKE